MSLQDANRHSALLAIVFVLLISYAVYLTRVFWQ